MAIYLSEAVTEFMFAKRSNALAPSTLDTYARSVAMFSNWVGQRTPDPEVTDLTVPMIREYMAFLADPSKRKPVTVAKLVRDLKVFCRWMHNEGMIPSPFFQRGRLVVPRFSTERQKAIDTEDFEKMLATANIATQSGRRDHAIMAFLYDTGVRVGELCNLRVGDVDLEAGTAFVSGKGKRERKVFFGPEVARSLKRYRNRVGAVARRLNIADPDPFFIGARLQPLTPSAVSQMLGRAARRAGVTDNANAHAFRHSFGRNWVVAGGDFRSLQQVMGHAQVTTTEGYAVLATGQLAAKHAQFSPMAQLRQKKR